MANNAQQYRVNGEAPISVGTGSAYALEVLGVTEAGASVEIIEHEEPVYSDVGGSRAPVDFKRMGREAFIGCRLISWNETTFRKCWNRPFIYPDASPFTPGDGVEVPRGQLLGSAGAYFPLAIAGQFEDPWYFFYCKLLGQPRRVTLGTNQTAWDVRFHAWTFIAGTATALTTLSTGSLPKLFARAIP